MKTVKLSVLVCALAFTFAGCNKYDDTAINDRLDNHEKRISTLEDAVEALETQFQAGMLITSVTELPDKSGYRIEFSGDSSRAASSIDILHGNDGAHGTNGTHGNHGVTPQIEVRTNPDGSTSIWYKTDGEWTDTGVDIRGPQGEQGDTGAAGPAGPQGSQGATGPAGAAGVSPQVRVVDNEDGTVTIQYNNTADYPDSDWTAAGSPIALDSNPDDKAPILSIVDNNGTIVITMNDGDDDAEPAVENTVFEFEKASTAVRFEIMTFDKVAIRENESEQIHFVVNPSNAWIPTTSDGGITKWQLNAVGTRASYVTPPTGFSITDIVPFVNDQNEILEGRYIAAIKCNPGADNLNINDHIISLVLNTGSTENPVLVSSPTFELGTLIARTWENIQTLVDETPKDGTLDLSGFSEWPYGFENATQAAIVTVSKNITINAGMDPILGQNASTYRAFRNVHFVLTDDATLTLDKVSISESPSADPVVSGDGNLILKEGQIMHTSPINITGDVTISGTIAELFNGNVNHTTEIAAIYSEGVTPNTAIRAHNVTINGGSVTGGVSTEAADAGHAIVASGDVTIVGKLIEFPELGYLESAAVFGGQVLSMATGNGGNAIEAAGKVTVTDCAIIEGGRGYGADVTGGDGIVAGSVEITGEYKKLSDGSLDYYPSVRVSGGAGGNGGNGGNGIITTDGGIDIDGGVYVNGGAGEDDAGTGKVGGSGIIAGGDVTLTGERVEPYSNEDWWYSLRVRSGQGDYENGVPFKFTDDANSPARTLTASTAQISDVDCNQNAYVAPWAMELQANDKAILDDCRLGWYTGIPLFSGGSYAITDPFTLWGTNEKGTPLNGNTWDGHNNIVNGNIY